MDSNGLGHRLQAGESGGFAIFVLLILLLAAALVLLIRLLRLKRQLSRMSRAVGTFLESGDPGGIRLPVYHNESRELSAGLNEWALRWKALSVRTQHLDESRKRMLSNLAHDFQTPLAAMLGYVEAVRDDPQLTDAERRAYLEIAARKGEELSRMFRDFFELSKLEADDTPVRLERVLLNETVPDWLLTFHQELEKLGLEPVLDLPDAPVAVWADARLLERVVNNLLINALRYGRSGGVIGFSVVPAADVCTLTVWDRGPGIAAGDLPFVFDRLYTGEGSRNRKLSGSGLGLTIAKRLVERQRGRIEVCSVPGERTEFKVILPLAGTQ
ncbi:sensor histidine kinase [Paenibacillus ehimensis]|uniref:histidine kinase n=1 Tax=Paenibacillus ehimensis TaxID=79264 RepID=A0ABT8VB44_9BACL|nr:HAMP domain-containing sensor histidine kinase [Paenibacillus ehimensis]MDO3678204.1 HAMP domain-containing sensor histidine kinase [Paenibacillus ehimensis]